MSNDLIAERRKLTSFSGSLDEMMKHATILVVDDQEANVLLITRLLERAGFVNVLTTTEGREAVSLAQSHNPDIVLLDLHMPGINGFEVISSLRILAGSEEYLPILVLTGDVTRDAKERALAAGARDFLTKPIDAAEVVLRMKNLLETRFLHSRLKDHNQILEDRVRERTWQLESARLEVLDRLAVAAEYRDDDTGEHTRRVGQMAASLARQLGLSHDECEAYRRAAPLHDVGKIAIPDNILLKPGKLTGEEFDMMKTHTTTGAGMLSESMSPLLQLAETIARTHHERWDGTGYMEGLSGEAIPLPGRVVAVADVFDALTHDRPYKKAWPIEEAVEEIRSQRGRQFDPGVVDAFLEIHGTQGPASVS